MFDIVKKRFTRFVVYRVYENGLLLYVLLHLRANIRILVYGP